MTADSGSICDVLPSAAALLGMADAPDPLALRDLSADARRVLVLLVDGMGKELLPVMAPHAPTIAAMVAGDLGSCRELRCTFPSTTPTSLVSLGTGVRPGEHGILGFTAFVPETGATLNHILWRGEPDPATWQPVPTWFERMGRAGIDVRALLPATFLGSGLTEAAYRGATFRGLGKDDDNAAGLIGELRRGRGRGLVYGYTAALDTAAHVHGVDSVDWQRAATDVDRLLTRLIEGLPSDALLLVTADHGGFNVSADNRFDVADDADLSAGVAGIAGEPRVRYLRTEPGATPDVVAAWRSKLAGHVEVYERDDAIARGWFGPVRDEYRARLGDVVAICFGDAAVLATAHEPPQVANLVGFHGGLKTVETAIPLIAVRGAQ